MNTTNEMAMDIIYKGLRQLYRNSENLTKMRIQAGNRICAYFFNQKMGITAGDSIYPIDEEEKEVDLINSLNPDLEDDEDEKDPFKNILKKLEQDYRSIWKVATQLSPMIQSAEQDAEAVKLGKTTKKQAKRNLNVITEDIFQPTDLIRNYVDYVMVKNYMELVKMEEQSQKDMEIFLEKIPYYQHLKGIRGIGTKMAAFIIAEIDIKKITYVSEIIAYAGLNADSKGRGMTTKASCDGCFRLYIEFETKRIKETEVFGSFQSMDRHRNAFKSETITLRPGIDNNKKKRIYIGRLDHINDIPNDVTSTNDSRVTKEHLTRLITLVPDEREVWTELKGNSTEIMTKNQAKVKYWQVLVNNTPTGIYVDDDKKYSISCQRSLTYDKEVQAKFIGTLGGCLMKANVKTVNGVKQYSGYSKTYQDIRRNLLNRPLTFQELSKYTCFKSEKGKKPKFDLNDLRKQVGEDGSFYDLPVEIRGKIEDAIAKQRNAKSHGNALRRMINQFIINEIYIPWRTLEGLPAHVSYAEGKLGIKHYTGTGNIGSN